MKKTILLLLLAAALAANAETVFIEAESFDNWGGWVNDTQFMDQMGSPYLLAHGLGNPVADAKTKFVATGGRYNIWVRTKNWNMWGQSPSQRVDVTLMASGIWRGGDKLS